MEGPAVTRTDSGLVVPGALGSAHPATPGLRQSGGSMGLDPFFRLKLELATDDINSAFKAGKIKLSDVKKYGLELIPESLSVTIKTV